MRARRRVRIAQRVVRPTTKPTAAAIRMASSGCSRTLLDTVSACSRTLSDAAYTADSARPAASATAGVTRSFISVSTWARNLAIWTDYRGVDPESFRDAGSSANTGDDFQGLGPPSYYILRVNVGF